MAGLRSFLLDQTAAGGDKAVLQYVTNLLNGKVGFLFNERFINIPAQVSLVTLKLFSDIDKSQSNSKFRSRFSVWTSGLTDCYVSPPTYSLSKGVYLG